MCGASRRQRPRKGSIIVMISPPSPRGTVSTVHIPTIPSASVPSVSSTEMAEVDRLATDVYGITLPQMMEQAGSHLAAVTAARLEGELRDRRILVAVGPGNNGGGGLVAARHLVNRGAHVRVVLARPARRLSEAGRHQLATLLEMGVSCCMAIYDISTDEIDEEMRESDLVIDAVLGYRGRGAPHDEVGALIERMAAAQGRILSLDVPSGMDPDSGIAGEPAIRAAATMTLALPKIGLLTSAGLLASGELFLADIGLPATLYARMGLVVEAPFASGRIVRLEA